MVKTVIYLVFQFMVFVSQLETIANGLVYINQNKMDYCELEEWVRIWYMFNPLVLARAH